MAETCRHAIVIGNQWPGRASGYQHAVESSLATYAECFDRVTWIGLTEAAPPQITSGLLSGIDLRHVPVRRRTKAVRFLRSLASPTPATATWPADAQALRACAGDLLATARAASAIPYLIIEGTPFASWARVLRGIEPHLPTALRTHEVLSQSFAGLEAAAGLAARWAWRLELRRLRRYESRVLPAFDCLWAITPTDATLLAERVGVEATGVFGVGFRDEDFDLAVPSGEPHRLLCLGSADLRKGLGLRRFLAEAWPRVRAAVPGARLDLAGSGTEVFADGGNGVHAHGFVLDDQALLRACAIFLNPQKIGGGLKIKTVVALLSGRAVVTTPNGSMGIPGRRGEHFLEGETPTQLAAHITALMRDRAAAVALARAGRAMARGAFGAAAHARQATPLVEAFADSGMRRWRAAQLAGI